MTHKSNPAVTVYDFALSGRVGALADLAARFRGRLYPLGRKLNVTETQKITAVTRDTGLGVGCPGS